MTQTAHTKKRRTAMVPVMTIEEVVLLSEEERVDMVAVLKSAEERTAAGDYAEHDPEAFVEDMMETSSLRSTTPPGSKPE